MLCSADGGGNTQVDLGVHYRPTLRMRGPPVPFWGPFLHVLIARANLLRRGCFFSKEPEQEMLTDV